MNETTEIRQAQVTEALLRMKKLDLHENVIKEFKESGKLNLSELIGMLYWLNDEEEQMVRDWEEKTGNLVYHVIKSHTESDLLYSFLYVSTHPEEWELDDVDLKEGCPVAYTKNVTCDYCSESGHIGIKPSFGGVMRIS